MPLIVYAVTTAHYRLYCTYCAHTNRHEHSSACGGVNSFVDYKISTNHVQEIISTLCRMFGHKKKTHIFSHALHMPPPAFNCELIKRFNDLFFSDCSFHVWRFVTNAYLISEMNNQRWAHVVLCELSQSAFCIFSDLIDIFVFRITNRS